MILEAIVPAYLKHLQTSAGRKDPRTEKDILHQLGVAIKTLISNAETLTKCVWFIVIEFQRVAFHFYVRFVLSEITRVRNEHLRRLPVKGQCHPIGKED